MASAKAATPSFFRPSTVFLTSSRCRCRATSKAPAPGTTDSSSIAFFTARSPSRAASRIIAIVWSFCPLIRIVHLAGFAEDLRAELLAGVHRRPPAGQDEALHVALLRAPQGHDARLLEHVQGDGVHPLLVDHDEVLVRVVPAHLPFQVDHLLHPVVCPLALGRHELLAVLRGGVHEARVDLRLLVLEGDVTGEDEAVLAVLLHVGVPRPVVQHEPLDQP